MIMAQNQTQSEYSPKQSRVFAVMLSIFIYGNAAGSLNLLNPNDALIASYAIALAMGFWIWILARHNARPARRSLGILLVFLLICALWATTILIQISDLRIDETRLPRQVLLLSLTMATAFPAYRAACRMSVAPALMLAAHLIGLIGSASVLLDAFGITHYESYGFRSFGFLSDPVAIALTFPFAVYLSCRRWLFLSLISFSLMATLSRGPILVSVAIVIQLFFVPQARGVARSLFILPLLAVVLFAANDRFGILFDRYSSFDEGRLLTPLEGLRIFMESPIFGYGYNAIGYFHPTIAGYDRLGVFSNASSTMVQMLSDGGLLLFLPYFFLAISITVTVARNLANWRSIENEGALAGAGVWIVSVVWVNQSSTWLVIGNFITPLLFGAIGAVCGAAQRSTRHEPRRAKFAAFS